MRGRKPKPTHLKLIDGNASRRPLNADEPMPEGDLGQPPSWMTAGQQVIWREAVAASPPGLLKLLDASIFTVWVVARALHQEASEKVARFGSVVKAPMSGQPMQSPYVGIMNRQAQIMMKAVSEMGFSPTSRSRVKVERSPAPDDAFGNIMAIED